MTRSKSYRRRTRRRNTPNSRRSRARTGSRPRAARDFHGPGESRLDLRRAAAAARRCRSRLERLVSRDEPRHGRIAAPSSSFPTAPASPPRCSATACSTQFEDIQLPSRDDSVRRLDGEGRRRGAPGERDGRGRGPAADRRQLRRRRGDERSDPPRCAGADARHVPDLHRSRSRRSSARRARTRPDARTASPTATNISRGWRRSISRRRTTTARRRAISTRRR